MSSISTHSLSIARINSVTLKENKGTYESIPNENPQDIEILNRTAEFLRLLSSARTKSLKLVWDEDT